MTEAKRCNCRAEGANDDLRIEDLSELFDFETAVAEADDILETVVADVFPPIFAKLLFASLWCMECI